MTVVAMPDWPVEEPFHSLAAVAGIAEAVGWTARTYDLGSELNHRAPVESRQARDWYDDVDAFAEAILARHGPWITGRLDEIIAEHPDVVGFTINMGTRHLSLFAGRYLKKAAPDILVMFGGPCCFPDAQEPLFPDGPWHEACDVVCRGEAELALRRFLTDYDRTESRYPTVEGFLYRRDGAVVDTGPPAIPDLKHDLYRLSFMGLDLDLYPRRGSLPFQLSRGCPYRCRFCSAITLFPRYRVRDAAEAFQEVREMAALVEARGDRLHLAMSDSIFNANVREMRRFLDHIIESGLTLTWRALVHIHANMTPDTLAAMRRSGCVRLFWGIESGSQDVVDSMGKNYRLADARRIITECSRLGMTQLLPILAGYPGETAEDVGRSVAFILEFRHYPKVEFMRPSTLKMYPNSRIGRDTGSYVQTGPSPDDWATPDGGNTLATRRLRAFILRNAQGNASLTRSTLADGAGFARLDFDDPVLAREYWDVVGGLFAAAGGDGWPAALPGGVRDLDAWMALDKSAPGIRAALAEVVLDGLRRLQATVLHRVEAAGDGPPLLRPVVDGMVLTRVAAIRGWLDRAEVDGDEVVVSGWAYDPAQPGQAVDILVYVGRDLVCRHRTSVRRDDVIAEHGSAAASAAFEFRVPRSSLGDWTTLFVVTQDGHYGRLGFNYWTITAF